MIDYNIFRTRLKQLISNSGKTSRNIAIDIGIAIPSLSRYASGERKPDLEYVVRIAQYFNVSVEWLLGISDEEAIKDSANVSLELVNLYEKASDDDKLIIQSILRKYK